MKIHGWGRFPVVESHVANLRGTCSARRILEKSNRLIAYGNGRSYGDSALSETILRTRFYDNFKSFDHNTGLLHVEAGVLLADIISVFVLKGWFLNVTPGTKYVTVGGAIASDVHGKNHHLKGCFSESVMEYSLLLASGEVITCSRNENSDIFRATCGGMGLTGVILDAKIYLDKINSSQIQQKTIKAENLREIFYLFNENAKCPYSVAWIDCLQQGDTIGRSLLMLGDFEKTNSYIYKEKSKITVPVSLPSITLNKYSIKAFNHIYYSRKIKESEVVDIDNFFYPLDSINNWNKVYGKNGFIQYQCVFPLESSYEGISRILSFANTHGKGSFLAVLKLFGDKNDNILSFPIKGFTLALDFKIDSSIFFITDELDKIVNDHGGRIYLAKDARMKKDVFDKCYPNADAFREFRHTNRMSNKFVSLQSRRLDL